MGTEMIVVNENWSMPKCIDEMRKQAEEMSEIYYVYVVDDDERLKGVLPLQKLITHPSVSKIKHVMKKDPISVRDSDSIEEVTETIEKYDLVALPVVWMRYASNTSVITSWHPVSRKTWKPRIMYSPKPPPAYLGC